jgi:ankyrin repeat protein
MIAAEYAREDTVQLMLDLGMDINARDYKGEVCLHDAVRSGIVDVVQLLLRNGAKVDVIDKYGRTPLRAVLDEPPTLFGADQGAVIELLLNEGASVDTEDEDGKMPLSIAISKGEKFIVDLFEVHSANHHKTRKHPLEADYDHDPFQKRTRYK